MQSLLAAWRVSLHRTRADWPIIAAAWLIVLLAATLLAAGPIYSNAVSLAGLHRVLHDAPIADANVEVTARVDPAEAPASLDQIIAQLHALARGTTVDVVASGRTDSYTLPGQDPEHVHDLVIFGFLEGIEEHATLLAGAWPLSVAPDAPMQVAIAEPTAETLGLQPGDQLSLLSRLEADRTLDVVVAGTYRINDPAEAYWWGDPTLVDGMEESPQYRTFGPLIATRDDLLARAAGNTVPLTWHAFPRIDELGIEQIGPLRAGLHALPSRVEETTPGRFPRVRTGLDEILEASERALLVSWTGILLLMAQLAILAGYALVLTAALIVDHRRLDTALLRSRGAGPAQMAGLALAEGLLLAVPAGLAGPWLAAAGLRGLNLAGPLAGIGLEIEPRVTGDAYLAAGAAAVACALLLVLPALFAARSFASEQSGRSRHETRTMGQRLGLDVALLALTAVGIWQLRLYGAPLTRTVHGALGLDPLLVAAPAIGLLAGGVVALRLLPLLAQAAEGLLARGRDLVGSLGTRQLARRPLRYTRASLLLMLAMSMGIFAVSYATTWITSQRDQANYQVGADLRVTPATGPAALPGWSLATAYTSAAGVSLAMPVERGRAQYRQGGSAGELLALDPATAGQTVAIRADLTSTSLATLFDPLTAARPAVDAERAAGRPHRHHVQATLSIDALEGDPQSRPPDPIDLATLSGESLLTASVYLLDARGLVYRFDATASPYEAGAQEIFVPLGGRTTAAQAAISAAGASFEYPIQVIGVDLVVSLPRTTHATAGTVALTGIASSETRDGSDWQPLDL
ncbi:MAG: FtsX-like permease family protein, partial [Candidatus Limnocylindria bacterium]